MKHLADPVPRQKAPSAELKAPSAEQKAPSAEQKAPSAELKAPSSELKAPSAELKAPPAEFRARHSKPKAPTAEEPNRRSPRSPTRAQRERSTDKHPPGSPISQGGTTAVKAACRAVREGWQAQSCRILLAKREPYQRLGHPRRGGKPEFKLRRCPPLDEPAC